MLKLLPPSPPLGPPKSQTHGTLRLIVFPSALEYVTDAAAATTKETVARVVLKEMGGQGKWEAGPLP